MTRKQRQRLNRTLAALALPALLMAIAMLRVFVYRPVIVEGPSMEPTLYQGDRLLVNTLRPLRREPPRDTIVVIRPEDGAFWAVKRVVGVAGDRVGWTRTGLWRNGEPVRESNTIPHLGEPLPAVEVPAGKVYVAGDNRPRSEDSRDYGPIERSEILGEVVAVLWPREHARRITAAAGE